MIVQNNPRAGTCLCLMMRAWGLHGLDLTTTNFGFVALMLRNPGLKYKYNKKIQYKYDTVDYIIQQKMCLSCNLWHESYPLWNTCIANCFEWYKPVCSVSIAFCSHFQDHAKISFSEKHWTTWGPSENWTTAIAPVALTKKAQTPFAQKFDKSVSDQLTDRWG